MRLNQTRPSANAVVGIVMVFLIAATTAVAILEMLPK